jgi:hypothetical protein
MAKPISLRCRCGAVRGVTRPVSARSGTHIVCYCDDCRAYVHQLERADLLDAGGGTDIFQMAPGDLEITQGSAQIRCLRLSNKGMHRFYAGCCRTPIANTLGARVPFVGVVHAFLELTPAEREALLGKPVGIMARFARGTPIAGAHAKMPVGLLLTVSINLLRWLLTGRGRSPFFGPDGQPVAPAEVLDQDTRAALG